MIDIDEIKLELFAAQNEIIKLQSEAINMALTLLMQHNDVDEAQLSSIKEKVDEAAAIRAEMNL